MIGVSTQNKNKNKETHVSTPSRSLASNKTSIWNLAEKFIHKVQYKEYGNFVTTIILNRE